MACLDNIPPTQFAVFAALIGAALAEELDVNEQNSIGNFLVSVGQTLLTIAAQTETQKAESNVIIEG